MASFNDGRKRFNTGSVAKGLQIKKEGDWQSALWMMQQLPTDIRASYIKAQITIAKRLKRIIREHIKNDDLGWRRLHSITVARKGHDRPWYDTGAIYNNISIITKGLSVFVGVKEGVMNYDGDRTLVSIAGAMEYGTSKMTARPLFLPSHKEIKGKYVRRVMGLHLTAKLMSKYGVKPSYR